jgi:hypothetical protein
MLWKRGARKSCYGAGRHSAQARLTVYRSLGLMATERGFLSLKSSRRNDTQRRIKIQITIDTAWLETIVTIFGSTSLKKLVAAYMVTQVS